jgi:cytochrome P450
MIEKEKRAILEEQENEAKGIDLDLIDSWISSNTEAMLKHQELKEYMNKQIEQRNKLENEMLEEGDRMTEILIVKEKLDLEKEELDSAPGDQKDESRIIEIDD